MGEGDGMDTGIPVVNVTLVENKRYGFLSSNLCVSM